MSVQCRLHNGDASVFQVRNELLFFEPFNLCGHDVPQNESGADHLDAAAVSDK
jgi:hypothetical protein